MKKDRTFKRHEKISKNLSKAESVVFSILDNAKLTKVEKRKYLKATHYINIIKSEAEEILAVSHPNLTNNQLFSVYYGGANAQKQNKKNR